MSEGFFTTMMVISVPLFVASVVYLCKKFLKEKTVSILAITAAIGLFLFIIITFCVYISQQSKNTNGDDGLDNSPSTSILIEQSNTPVFSVTPTATPNTTPTPTPEVKIEGELEVSVYEWCASIIPTDISNTGLYDFLGSTTGTIEPTIYLRDVESNNIEYVISKNQAGFYFSKSNVYSGDYLLEIICEGYCNYSEEIKLDPNYISEDGTWETRAYIKPAPYSMVRFSMEVFDSNGEKNANRVYELGTLSYRTQIQSDENGDIPLRFEARKDFLYYLTDIATNETTTISVSFDGEQVCCYLQEDQINISRLSILFREWVFSNTIDGYTIENNRMLSDIYPEIIVTDSTGNRITGRYTKAGYSFDDLSNGTYSVTIIASGYNVYSYDFTIKNDTYTVGADSYLLTDKDWLEFVNLVNSSKEVFDFTVKVINESGNPVGNTEFILGTQNCLTVSESNSNGVLKSEFSGVENIFSIAFYDDYKTQEGAPISNVAVAEFTVDHDGEIVVIVPNK